MYFYQEDSKTLNVDVDTINDSDDENEVLGTSGLINLGNTCYMNSIIQCLSNCEDFKLFILSDEFINKIISSNTNYKFNQHTEHVNNFLSYQLRRIFSNLWNSSFYSFRPITFRKLFGNKINQFQNSDQHDSQEALLCILDTINEETQSKINITPVNRNLNYEVLESLFKNEDDNNIKILNIIRSNLEDYLNFKSIYDYKKSHNFYSKINSIFEGRTIYILECDKTKGIKAKFESFFYLTLSIPYLDSDSESESESDSESDSESSSTSKATVCSKCISELNDDVSDNESCNNDDEAEKSEAIDNESSKSDDSDNESDNSNDSDSNSKNSESSDLKLLNQNIQGKIKQNNNKITLYDLFDKFIENEMLTDNNKWFSPYAYEYVDANSYTLLWDTPKILIVLIKRFEFSYTGGSTKISHLVEFPINDFDITKYVHPSNKKTHKTYDLIAINNHASFSNKSGLSFGHYYSYCKNNLDNKWYYYDDETVKQIDEDKLITNNAYMLFYQAKS